MAKVIDKDQKDTNLTKKRFTKLKEVGAFYKLLHKYNLRENAYKNLLQIYIDSKNKSQP